jgi:hypothetical protein
MVISAIDLENGIKKGNKKGRYNLNFSRKLCVNFETMNY